jgi:hypothetical protein
MPITLAISFAQKHKLPQLTHAEFQAILYKDLFTQGYSELECKPISEPLVEEHQHIPVHSGKKQYCTWCKLQIKKQKQPGPGKKQPRPKQTYFICQICGIPLCRPEITNCWRDFHLPRAPLSERDVNIK